MHATWLRSGLAARVAALAEFERLGCQRPRGPGADGDSGPTG